MNRAWLLVLLSPLCLFAQFSEIAVTDDGRQVYFSSTLRLKGQLPARSEYRIYRYTEAGGIELFAERGDLAYRFGGGSSDGARMPQVSGDGQTVALTLQGICEGAAPCNTNTQSRGEIRGHHAGVLGPGSAYLSRNGKWALLFMPADFFDSNSKPSSTLINLESGEQIGVPPIPSPFLIAKPLASNGTVLIQDNSQIPAPPGAVALWQAGHITLVSLPNATSVWGLSDNGSRLFYLARKGAVGGSSFRFSLMARNLINGLDTELAVGENGAFPQLMSVTNDGRYVLYRVTTTSLAGVPFLVDTDSGRSTPISLPAGELAIDGAISGFGNAALLLTDTGRIVRIDLASGSTAEIVPLTPYIPNTYQFSAGSLVRLQGTLPHSAAVLANAILLDGRPVPVLYANDKEIGIQVPWELSQKFEASLQIDLPGSTPFQQSELVHIPPMAPLFEGFANPNPGLPGLAFSADFSHILTVDPQPGEIFNMYMTGLGAVQGTVATGAATPTGPVFPIVGTITCLFWPYTDKAETLFAGLAPNLIGIYQVTFRMPQRPNPGKLTGGRCDVTSQSGGGVVQWGFLTKPNP